LDRRLARWLSECYERSAVGNELRLTHEFLGAMVGSQRSSVTEVIRTLVSRGCIQADRAKITILDIAGLKRCACECRSYIERLRTAFFPELS
jgi:hypothetical protein